MHRSLSHTIISSEKKINPFRPVQHREEKKHSCCCGSKTTNLISNSPHPHPLHYNQKGEIRGCGREEGAGHQLKSLQYSLVGSVRVQWTVVRIIWHPIPLHWVTNNHAVAFRYIYSPPHPPTPSIVVVLSILSSVSCIIFQTNDAVSFQCSPPPPPPPSIVVVWVICHQLPADLIHNHSPKHPHTHCYYVWVYICTTF